MRQIKLVRLLVSTLLLLSVPAGAEDACLAELRTAVVQELGANENLDALLSNLEILPRVVAADQSQPEFTSTFTEYYSRRVSPTRIEKGREMKLEHANLLAALRRQYGVQADYLLALWGLETNFGSYMGNLSVPSALATLTCDGRRAAFFRSEFMHLARIAVNGDIAPEAMRGSWAGAMGHMQFMPSTYTSYATDHDGDGKVDVYASLPDAFASAANYLAKLDWQPGYRWGREVLVPDAFDYATADYNNWQTLHYWRRQGIKQTNGKPMPDMDLPAALILPMGHQGPAFLVYPNFKAIMSWNRSINYAIAVGRLADRIAGLGSLHTKLPSAEQARWRLLDMQRWQAALNSQGFDAGSPDGVLGSKTRAAIRAHQQKHGLISDGYPHPEWVALINQQ